MTRDAWLAAHAYLAPVARFCGEVEEVLRALGAPSPAPARFDDYAADYAAGMPLFASPNGSVELEPGGEHAALLIAALPARLTDAALAAQTRALGAELARSARPAQSLVDWLLGDSTFAPTSPGLLRFLGWSALEHHLRPLLGEFARWRDEERWLPNDGPACGAPPAMAQLVGVDPGRKRFLVCGACRTRWRYRRTACPFCESDSLRLGIVGVEGEGGLRIDHCADCRGYLKTLDGQADQDLLLADWTSLHLDVIAQDRGLKRLAGSLFDLEALQLA
jgi:FdhE protein